MAIVVGKDVATGSYAFSWGDEMSHNPPVELDDESDSTVKERLLIPLVHIQKEGVIEKEVVMPKKKATIAR